MFEPTPAESEFFEQTFADTMVLMETTRDSIVSGTARGKGLDLQPVDKMRLSQELSRLTSRSANAMSLLLMYKAIITGQSGEIENLPVRLDELYDGITAPSVAQEAGQSNEALPAEIQGLLAKSEEIFSRMDQIYRMIAAQIAN